MKKLTLLMILTAALAAGGLQAQVVPALPAVQNAIDRQAERARDQAVQRAQEQASERARNQMTEQVSDQIASQVADQAVDRVQNQAVEQAAGRVRNQADNIQNQVLERVQNQAERAQNQADRAVNPAERVQNRANEQAQARALGLQNDTARALERAAEASANARVQERSERATGTQGLTTPPPGQGGGQPGRALPAAAQAAQAAAGRAEDALARVPGPSPMAQLPERLPINDSNGNQAFVEIRIEPNVRALEREWVMLLNADQRQMLMREAPDLMQFLDETQPFTALNSFLLKFRVPPDLDADGAVLELVPEPLRELMDRNHVYSAQSAAPGPQSSLLPLPMSSVCEQRVSVGMIDSAIRVDHPAFASPGHQPALITRAFIDQNLVEPAGHGTAVAGVMIGMGEGLRPLLPNATVYGASVVYAQDVYNQGATVLHLLQALDWLIAEPSLQVINISMTGPPNRLLAQGVAAAQQNGKVIVAAAGNEGPFAGPLYPAAYDGVVAVTAVAIDGSIYRWANQGEHLSFSALGVSVPTARVDGSIGRESGTSMAAPVISAFLACELLRQEGDVARALERLRAGALDLGAPGRDPVFGHGLLHP